MCTFETCKKRVFMTRRNICKCLFTGWAGYQKLQMQPYAAVHGRKGGIPNGWPNARPSAA